MRLGIRGGLGEMEKARRDLSRLTKKVIQNKSRHRQTVYVRMGLPMNKWYSHLLSNDELKAFIVEARTGKEINNPIDIELSDKRHQDNEVLTFKGEINGEIDFVEEVRVKHNGQLALVTCYRPKRQGGAPRYAKASPGLNRPKRTALYLIRV